jgi:hypothetical protein
MSGKISFKIDRNYLARIINKTGTATEDRVFERFFLPISNTVFENKEAKASQGGTTGNERKYSILGSISKICE